MITLIAILASVLITYFTVRKHRHVAAVRHHGKHWRAKITISLAQEIRAQLTGRHGEQAHIARRFGLSDTCISRISKGRTYHDL